MTDGVKAGHSVHSYSTKVSAGGPREPGWTPLGTEVEGRNVVLLQDLGGIQVDREILVSPS